MAYQVLARKYRPQRFSDVYGQEHVTRTLLNALEQRRTAHGYIFSGHRGIGKTTVARILAMALNCHTEMGSAGRPSPEPCGACVSCQEIRAGNSIDMMEIDAATNRGIDEIRELRDTARYRPARDRYRIYLLDEAHQITDAAFNALLKTLEEPPDHVVFMMATTQPEDIPQTIRSRCQHFSFHAVKFDAILAQLRQIAGLERIHADDAALSLLAEAGDGSVRDALSIMDQAIASAPLEESQPKLGVAQIQELIGAVPNTVFARLLEDVHQNQSAAVMEEVDRLLNAGSSPSQLARQMVRYLRNCLMAKLGGESTELLQISADERHRAASSAALFSEEDLARFLAVMLRTFDELSYRQEQRFHLELGLLKLVHLQRLIPLEEILASLPGSSTIPAAPRTGQGGSGTGALPPPSAKPTQHGMSLQTAPPQMPTTAPTTVPQTLRTVVPTTPMDAATHPGLPLHGSNGSSGSSGFGGGTAPPRHELTAVTAIDCGQARDAAVAALEANGHSTAASLLQRGHWSIAPDGSLQAQIAVKQTMLALTMSADAQRIVRDSLREIGITQPIRVLPGESLEPGEADAVAPRSASRHPGSIQEVALENPLVLQTMELFRAEVRSVVDLRESSREDSWNKR